MKSGLKKASETRPTRCIDIDVRLFIGDWRRPRGLTRARITPETFGNPIKTNGLRKYPLALGWIPSFLSYLPLPRNHCFESPIPQYSANCAFTPFLLFYDFLRTAPSGASVFLVPIAQPPVDLPGLRRHNLNTDKTDRPLIAKQWLLEIVRRARCALTHVDYAPKLAPSLPLPSRVIPSESIAPISLLIFSPFSQHPPTSNRLIVTSRDELEFKTFPPGAKV